MSSALQDHSDYHAILGVAPGADMAAIRAAYRARALSLHPDRNPSARAREEFQRVSEAYAALRGDGVPPPVSNDDGPRPCACDSCGRVTAQPRYLVMARVKSFFVWARLERVRGVFCRDCADRAAARASTYSWLHGWWSLPGLLLTPCVLVINLLGGLKPKSENARLLIHQSGAFLARGELDIARALALQAQGFARTEAQRRQIGQLLGRSKGAARTLKGRWGLWSGAFVAQLLPLVTLPVLAGLFAVINTSPWDEPVSTSADILVKPASVGELRHVALDALKLRVAADDGAPVLTLLDRFTTVEVIAVGDPSWTEVRTPAGQNGFVPTRALYAGSGEQMKRQWCAENRGSAPEAGEIFSRRASGDHRLLVHNDGRHDAVVKLKTLAGATALSFFIPATYHIAIPGVPQGTYRIEFALGSAYSRGCGTFLGDMRTAVMPFVITFKNVSAVNSRAMASIPEISLVPPASDPRRPQAIAAELFAADD